MCLGQPADNSCWHAEGAHLHAAPCLPAWVLWPGKNGSIDCLSHVMPCNRALQPHARHCTPEGDMYARKGQTSKACPRCYPFALEATSSRGALQQYMQEIDSGGDQIRGIRRHCISGKYMACNHYKHTLKQAKLDSPKG